MGVFGRKIHVTETPDVRHITNESVMHEESDVNVKGVATFVGALAVFGIIICVIVYGLFLYFEKREARNEEKEFHSPLARLPEERRPPQSVPHLQAAPGMRAQDDPNLTDPRSNLELKEPDSEWKLLREKYEYELTHEGQPDPSTGQRRVPIDQAMQQLLQQGLPARATPQPGDPTIIGGMDIPSYSSAGRQTEKRDQ
ncbi:MAG TPA: hypothetical protein VF525_05915 [Pyrinomonadaceae bacterium]|jgi:hypothetical protein